MTVKERLHHLVNRLPESELQTAERFLERLARLDTGEGPQAADRKADSERVVVDQSALPFLNDGVKDAVGLLVPVLTEAARQSAVPVNRIEVRGFTDPEEGGSEVVVRQWVDLPAEAALDYWDRLAPIFDDWIEHLPPRLGRIVEERIRLSVDWTNNE